MNLLVSRLKFAATVTAPSCARVFAEYTLKSWLLPDVVDDAGVIVSELVTNAVRATGLTDPDPAYADLAGLALLAVQIRVTGTSLFVEVWDNDCPRPPRPSATAIDPDERGRGLIIVAALSRRHGIAASRRGGKIAWAQLDAVPVRGPVAGPRDWCGPLPRGHRRVALAEARQPGDRAQACRPGGHAADLALLDRLVEPVPPGDDDPTPPEGAPVGETPFGGMPEGAPFGRDVDGSPVGGTPDGPAFGGTPDGSPFGGDRPAGRTPFGHYPDTPARWAG